MQASSALRRNVCLAALAILALTGLAASSAAAAQSELQRTLDAIVGKAAGPPGISVLIRRDGRREFLRAGVADVRSGRPPAPTDRMRIASIAKAFNAVIALDLEEDGRLGLGETLGERTPGLLPKGDAVTLRQLLQHTSGLADYIRAPAFIEGFLADPGAYLSPQQLIDFVREDDLEFPPGSRYHYSDTDNIAAALMAEAATGRSYEQLLASRIFGPLGMSASSLPRTTRMPAPYLHGYDVEPGKKAEDVSRLINPAGAWASGGIVSTPRDLAAFGPTYITTVLAASRRISSPFRPGSSSPPGPGQNSAGLGVFRYRTACGTVYGHTGSFPGYRLLLAASADGSRLVVFSVNAQIVPGQGSPKVAKEILRAQRLAVCRALH